MTSCSSCWLVKLPPSQLTATAFGVCVAVVGPSAAARVARPANRRPRNEHQHDAEDRQQRLDVFTKIERDLP